MMSATVGNLPLPDFEWTRSPSTVISKTPPLDGTSSATTPSSSRMAAARPAARG